VNRNRFIIIVSVLIVISIGILLHIQAQGQKPPVKEVVVDETENMKSSVMGLYTTYQKCMTTPPKQAIGQVSTYCQANNAYTSADFISNLKKGGVAAAGADPITCAQNTVQNTRVGTINPQQKTAEVIESFGDPATDVKIKVSLVKVENAWKVDNVICPLP
jgi:hypothetical protein